MLMAQAKSSSRFSYRSKRSLRDFTDEGSSPTKAMDEDGSPASKRPRKEITDIADKVFLGIDLVKTIAHIFLSQPPVDFFGRPITVVSATATKAAARKNVDKKYRVSFRYTEGTSAAVRKPVKVGAFL